MVGSGRFTSCKDPRGCIEKNIPPVKKRKKLFTGSCHKERNRKRGETLIFALAEPENGKGKKTP